MVQWWERSPSTNVAQVIYVGWAVLLVLILAPGFRRVLRFSSLHKIQPF